MKLIMLFVALNLTLVSGQTDEDFLGALQEQLDRAFAAPSPAEARKLGENALTRLAEKEADLGGKASFHLIRGYFLGHILERDAEGLAAFRKATELEADHPEAHFMTGEALIRTSQIAEARPFIEKAIALQPNHGQSYVYLGFIHEHLNEGEKAESAYLNGLKEAPDHRDLRASLAAYYSSIGSNEKAIPLRKAILDAIPNDSAARWNYAQTLQVAGKKEDALREFVEFRKRFPDDAEALEKICQLAEATGNFSERDQAREALYRLYASKNPPQLLKDRPFFIRDQFSVGGLTVYALEYFELSGERPVKYNFAAYREDPGDLTREFFIRISLGSYETTQKTAQEKGELKKGERLYHLDAYPPDGSHATLAFFKVLPDYSEVKKQAIEAIHFLTEKKGQ